MAGLSDTYIVHCAQASCDYGMRDSRIVLQASHGVYVKGQAQMDIKDCRDWNVVCFGGCMSPDNPDTAATAKAIAREVAAETQMDFEGQVTEIFTQDAGGGKKGLACFGICTPRIVSEKWDRQKEDVAVTPDEQALLGEAVIHCGYGGIIRIVSSGQEE